MEIRRDGTHVLFDADDVLYELTSHPYEPCLYIRRDGKLACVLHNAFDEDSLADLRASGEVVTSITGRELSHEEVCRILAAALASGRGEMNFSDAEEVALPPRNVRT